MKLFPTADKKNEIIDVRKLRFECDFSGFSKGQVVSLADSYCQCVCELFSSDYLYLTFVENRYSKHPEADIRKKLNVQNSVFTYFEGDAISDKVCDMCSLNGYRRELYSIANCGKPMFCSADYPEYFIREILPYLDDKDVLIGKMQQLFTEPTRSCLKPNLFHDIGGTFTAYCNTPNAYCGFVSIEISIHCIQNHLGFYADRLLTFLKGIASEYMGLDGRLGVSSPLIGAKNWYSNLFSCSVTQDNKLNYICGLSWANVVSPQMLERHRITPAVSEKIEKRILSNGGLLLKPLNGPDADNHEELIEMKRALYNALLPGRTAFSFQTLKDTRHWSPAWKPRCNWEEVPVLPEEFIATDNAIVIQSCVR